MKRTSAVVALSILISAVFLLVLGCSGSSDPPSRPSERPQQTVAPYLDEVGITVCDLSASKAFYEEIIGLAHVQSLTRDNRDEEILQCPLRLRKVILMHYTDGSTPNCRDNPVKLVFLVVDAEDAYEAIVSADESRSVSPPTTFEGVTVALVKDPDGYLVELIEYPVDQTIFFAVGIGVGSLDHSEDFYTRVLGLLYGRDIAVPGFMDEVELRSPVPPTPPSPNTGLYVILMHYLHEYLDEDSYRDIPVKLVFSVDDAVGFAEVIFAEDPAKLLVAPVEDPDYGNAVVGLAKDLEGYLIQIKQVP